MIETFYKAASAFESQGLRLVLLGENSKAPLPRGWQVTPTPASTWLQKPNNNIGLNHFLSGTCAIDIDDLGVTRLLFDALDVPLTKLLQEGLQITSGRANRAKLLYRIPDEKRGVVTSRHALMLPNKDGKGNSCILEIRAGKTQDVLPPSLHPDTGKPYEWIGNASDIPVLPAIFIDMWENWDEWKARLEGACPWKKAPASYTGTLQTRPLAEGQESVIDAFNKHFFPWEVIERFGYLPRGGRWLCPDSSTKDPGVVVLEKDGKNVIFSHHGSDPLATGHAHDAFSAFTILLHNGDLRAAVRDAADALGIESHGPSLTAEEKAIVKGFMAEAQPQEETKKTQRKGPPPHEGPIPVQAVRELEAYLKGQLQKSKPGALRAGALALASHIAARRATTATGGPISLHFGVYDSSTAAHSEIADVCNRFLADLGTTGRNSLRGGDFTQASQILSHLLLSPRIFFATDTYGHKIRAQRRQTSGALAGTLSLIGRLYGGQTQYLDKSESADENHAGAEIYAPNITLLALLSERDLGTMALPAHYGEGVIQRTLTSYAGDNFHFSDGKKAPYPALFKRARSVLCREKESAFDSFTTEEARFSPDKAARPVLWAEGVEGAFYDLRYRLYEYFKDPAFLHLRGMAQGYLESAKRLASVLGAIECPEGPYITENIAIWAGKYTERCLWQTLEAVRVQGAGDEDLETAIIETLRRLSKDLSLRDLKLYVRRLRKEDDPLKILRGLCEDGLLEEIKTPQTVKWRAIPLEGVGKEKG